MKRFVVLMVVLSSFILQAKAQREIGNRPNASVEKKEGRNPHGRPVNSRPTDTPPTPPPAPQPDPNVEHHRPHPPNPPGVIVDGPPPAVFVSPTMLMFSIR
jgi:hypothetical protein